MQKTLGSVDYTRRSLVNCMNKLLQIAESAPPTSDKSCTSLTKLPYTDESEYDISDVILDQVINIRCKDKYRNSLAPCESHQLRCEAGKWVGVMPICVPVHDCLPPPRIPYASLALVSYETSDDVQSLSKFPFRTKVTYQCVPGYHLQGNPVFTCATNGCWQPSRPPVCLKGEAPQTDFSEEANLKHLLMSLTTGVFVVAILLLICYGLSYKRKPIMTGTITLPPTVQRVPEMNDHGCSRCPDRLALIAFAEAQNGGSQNSLPSYEEAIRHERNISNSSVPTNSRPSHTRPHWPNLSGARRIRNSPNSDFIHIVRHGSFASHTPSTRSCGGDSMGSTDTVGASEGSTNVTLDTVSSISGSQNASCRVHCGSLASFDGCSLANHDGEPLLEESELEEIQGGHNELDNLDNTSSKISTNSAPVMMP